MLRFDASITIGPHHLAAAGLEGQPDIALDVVRRAVRGMEGAKWIDVAAQCFPPECQGWVTIYPSGRCVTPETLAWQELRYTIETIALAAMTAAGAQS
jgi:hypothetical protein